MTTTNVSSDSAVIAFIAAQNANRPISSTNPYVPQPDQNGIAGTTTDNVIGLSSIAAGAAAINLGSGMNTVIVESLHGTRSQVAGDGMIFNVDATGTVTLEDIANPYALTTQTITGVSFLLFQDAATGSNSAYNSIYFIGDANQSEIVRLYNAAFGRQPDVTGVEFYVNILKAGQSFDTIAGYFMASPEFQARYGANVSDTQFIDNLYQNVLSRAPSASEVTYYLNALHNNENGVAYTDANPSWSRAQELLNFTNSAECQKNVSGFVINTSLGGYADSALVLNPATVLNQAEANHYLNAALLPTFVADYPSGPAPTTTDDTISASPQPSGYAVLAALANNLTIQLAPNAPNIHILIGDNNTVYAGAENGSIDSLVGQNNTVFLSAFSMTISQIPYAPFSSNFSSINKNEQYIPSNVTVVGFIPGTDIIKPPLITTNSLLVLSAPIVILDASHGQQISGPALSFSQNRYVLELGNVGGGSAAEVASAANAVYTLAELPPAVPGVSNGENLTIIGQTSSGDTVIYDFMKLVPSPSGGSAIYPYANPDIHGTHQMTADELTYAATLVGVKTSALSAHDFGG